MACANDMLQTLYGTNDNFNWAQYGLPQNKYERAAWTMKVKTFIINYHDILFHCSCLDHVWNCQPRGTFRP